MDLTEIKNAIEEQGKANHARITTLEQAVKDMEKSGKVSAETKQTLDRIVTEMAALESVKSMPARLAAIEAAIKRSGAKTADGDELPEDHKEAKAAFDGFLRKGKGRADDGSWQWEKHQPAAGVKSLSVLSDPDGGFAVTSDLNGRIVKRVFETSDMRALCSVQTISGDALEGFYDDNEAASGGWVGEAEARAESNTPAIGKWTLPAHEQYAYPFTTQKNLDDSSWNVEAWLADKVADIIARTENTAFLSGTGIKKPKGILAYTAGTTLRTQIEQIKTGANGDVTYAGLVNIQMGIKSRYRARAKWAMSRACLAKVMGLVDSQGRPIWQPSMQAGAPTMLLGHEVAEFADFQAVATNSLSLAFADWQEAYQIVDRIGIRILRNPFASLGKVGFYTTKRTGGDVLNTEAIKIGKMAA